MGTVGDALDNAVAERFFATLECELLDRYDWPTRQALRTAVFDVIEVFYNRQRRHSTPRLPHTHRLRAAAPITSTRRIANMSTKATLLANSRVVWADGLLWLGGVRWCTPRVHEVVGDVDAAKAQPCGSGDDRAGRTGGVSKGLPGDPDT
jgi:integrase-like protein